MRQVVKYGTAAVLFCLTPLIALVVLVSMWVPARKAGMSGIKRYFNWLAGENY